MDKLKELLSKCKCGVYLSVNEHKDNYLTTPQRLEEIEEYIDSSEIPDDVREKIIETDTLIEIELEDSEL